MENVLKALDPKSSNSNFNVNPSTSSFLNGLNLDTSFTTNKGKSLKYDKSSKYDNFDKYEKYDNFDYLKPVNRSNIIKSHGNNNNNLNKPTGSVSFQHPPSSQFFSNPDESFVNMTLPAMDTSLIFSDKASGIGKRENHNNGININGFNGINNNNNNNNNHGNIKTNYLPNVPNYSHDQREKEQFVSFAVQQYRMLAGLNPEMMRSPDNLDDLADRETFKYWAKLFIDERERQARIVLNLQKALTEALSGSAAKGPIVMSHLGLATGDFEMETIGINEQFLIYINTCTCT